MSSINTGTCPTRSQASTFLNGDTMASEASTSRFASVAGRRCSETLAPSNTPIPSTAAISSITASAPVKATLPASSRASSIRLLRNWPPAGRLRHQS